jgi:hypothetical protein
MSVAIFESEFGDAQFVELVEAFCDHAIVIGPWSRGQAVIQGRV